jgi:hypothetical protein
VNHGGGEGRAPIGRTRPLTGKPARNENKKEEKS